MSETNSQTGFMYNTIFSTKYEFDAKFYLYICDMIYEEYNSHWCQQVRLSIYFNSNERILSKRETYVLC